MNEILEAIKTRRSVRKFSSRMPDTALIDQVIEAGLYAASGKNRQCTLTLAVTDPVLREKLRRDNAAIGSWQADHDPFYGAPVILTVLAEKDFPTHVYDGSLVLGNMMLAAHALGLAGVWIHRAKEEFEREDYRQLLRDRGVDGEWEGIGHLALGYIEGEAPAPKPRRDGRVLWVSGPNEWNQ